jgi:DNA repair exonuclease SbcCD nuclease subunit
VKVLHTGDLHLGMTHTTRNYSDALRRKLVEARQKTLVRLVDAANEDGCDLLVVAGDLFHSNRVGKDVVLGAVKALAALEGVAAVLPGNHDYYSDMAMVWKTFRENAPENVLVLSETKPYLLHDFGLDVALYPAPCDRKHSAENRLGWIVELAERPTARYHFGIAHGTVRGISPDFDNQYFPMEREELVALQLDHWFMGHAHVRVPATESAENCGIQFCGTPEPDGFDCSHGGNAWVTTFDDHHVLSQVFLCGEYRFMELGCEVRSLDDIRRMLTEAAAEKVLVKLAISGMLPEEAYRGRGSFLDGWKERFAYLEIDDTALGVEVSAKAIAEEFPTGSFPRLFLSSLLERGDQDALQLAYQLVKKVKK